MLKSADGLSTSHTKMEIDRSWPADPDMLKCKIEMFGYTAYCNKL